MPLRLVGVIGGGGFGAPVESRDESNTDGVAARVTARIAECRELLHRNLLKPCLFFQLARRCPLKRFVFVNQAAGNRPRAFEWITCPLDQQHLYALAGA